MEAAVYEPFTLKEEPERAVRRAGLMTVADESATRAYCVSPIPIAVAVEIPKVFQVRKGASSSYCPMISWALSGIDDRIKKHTKAVTR
jgi:hypothetical protein